jgi:hypothetical protein
MRNSIKFGYTQFAGKTLVKLNVKISDKQAIALVQKYTGLVQWDNGKFGKALEGVMDYSKMESFHKDLEIARIDAQIDRLLDKKTSILDSFTRLVIDAGSLDNPFL